MKSMYFFSMKLGALILGVLLLNGLIAQGKPRVSIITSVFDGDVFINEFLNDLTQQTIFNECELILINANSPGNEESVIKEFMQKYPNVIYKRLERDPGIYGVWNLGIQMASADLVTNANLDDRRNPKNLEEQATFLEENRAIDLVYGNYMITNHINETYQQNSCVGMADIPEFSHKIMYLCLPGPQPMWRKSMHERAGNFREDFKHSGDLEMWNRAVSTGSIFKKLPTITGLYYYNPKGLSTDQSEERVARRKKEDAYVIDTYQSMWNVEVFEPKVSANKWSILICTLDEREAVFKKLHDKLTAQITANNLQDQVEILSYKDNREQTIGFKRNALIDRSNGEYVNFLDDDDDIHGEYVKMIYEALSTNPDCVKLVGIMTTRGINPQRFIHSVVYNGKYGYEDGAYIRPPNHLNTIKRSVASQFKFPQSSFAEDMDWTLQIAASGLLKNEAPIEEPYYFYQYDGKYDQPNMTTLEKKVENAEALPLYFCTAANDQYYDCLLNLIGSIHRVNFEQLGKIAVFDIGLTAQQIKELNDIKKVRVYEVERVHPEIIKPVPVNNWGKMVPGWYAWKPVALKQALDMFPYVLWLDSATTVLQPLDGLFKHIKKQGYFLTTIGNECDAGVFRHPVRWQTTRYLIEKMNLDTPENKKILDYEAIGSNIWGCSRECSNLFIDDMYEMAKDLKNFSDDGTTPQGFGTARHDQMVLSAVAYLKNLTVLKQDYTQQEPMYLNGDDKTVPFNITWHGQYVCDKTAIYSSRSDLNNKEYYLGFIRKNDDVKK